MLPSHKGRKAVRGGVGPLLKAMLQQYLDSSMVLL